MSIDVLSRLHSAAQAVEKALCEYFKDSHGELSDAMQYSLLGGGKRIRAYLTLTFAEMFGADKEAAMPYACAIEAVHAYSLIHDDLPAMDNDDFRRGKPSCHKKYGEACALLAGDSLLTLAFELCASNTHVSDRSVRLAVASTAHLAGYLGMCGGQQIDLSDSVSSFEQLCHLHSLKTAALIKASCLLGVYAACDDPDEKTLRAVSEYAEGLGLAFQIHDDILDVVGDSAALGKPVGSDAANDKKTAVSYMTLEEAVLREREATCRATDALSCLPNSEPARALAEWLMSRNN